MADETAAIMLGMGPTQTANPGDEDIAAGRAPSNSGTRPFAGGEDEDGGAASDKGAAEDRGSAAARTEEDGDGNAAASTNDDGDAGGDSKPPATARDDDVIDTSNDAAIALSLSLTTTPRRRIKKRREDDFVYGEEATRVKKARPKQPAQALPEEPAKRPPRKRPRRCPAKDSIIIEVPLNVTADLAVAMRRTRRKRIRRIKEWVASGAAAATSASGEKSNESNQTSGPGNGNDNGKKGAPGEDKDRKADGDNNPSALGEGEYDDLDGGGGPLHRNQYGSMVDYLEAKYVRGVMIEDYDERVKKKRRRKVLDGEDGEAKGDSDDEDSEGSGSCYDSDDWIDDSLLHEEVAGQVVASSAYGRTQIEEEAWMRKEDRRKRGRGAEDGDGDNGVRASEGAVIDVGDGKKSDDEDDRSDEGGLDSDFDHGFFVNLGDLEMAEGWKEESEIIASPTKKEVKKKRAYNKKSAHWFAKGDARSKGAKSDKSMTAKSTAAKKKKNANAKAPAPGAQKKLVKKAKAAAGKKEIKKKKEAGKAKKAGSKMSDGKAKKVDSEKSKKVDDKSKADGKPAMPKKKKMSAATSPDKIVGETDAGEKYTEKDFTTKTDPADKDSKKEPKAKTTPKEKKMTKTVVDKDAKKEAKAKAPPQASKEKEKAMQLRKKYKRMYHNCVKMIREMTPEELPKKQKSKSTMKVSVNIPPGKSIGDEITFANPNVPGQKLKVKIPKKADMMKRNFVVSVPAPKVTEPEVRENNFPKEFKEALSNFARAFDDWCVAEGAYSETLPVNQRKPFKPGTEKLKKFDDMVEEFPKNLATPIDLSYLRKIVRQERSNKSRREKRKDSGGGGNAAGGGAGELKTEPQQLSEIQIHFPQKGTEFLSVAFSREDFDGK